MTQQMRITESELKNIIAECKGSIIYTESTPTKANAELFLASPLNTLETMIPMYNVSEFIDAFVSENPFRQDREKFEITIYLSIVSREGDMFKREVTLKVANVNGWEEYQQRIKKLNKNLEN